MRARMPSMSLRALCVGGLTVGLCTLTAVLLPGLDRALAILLILGILALLAVIWKCREAFGSGSGRPADNAEVDFVTAPIQGAPGYQRVVRARRTTPGRLVPPMAGSPSLQGRIALASVFLGRDGRSWSETEITSTVRALEKAGAWLEAEAAAWGVRLEIDMGKELVVGADDRPRGDHALEFGLQENESALFDAQESAELLRGVSAIAAGLGLHDFPTLVAALSRRMEADHVVWFLHSLSQGQSHFLDERHTGVPGLQLATCYTREGEPSGPSLGPVFSDPVTYAHEFLHAFGATDKYGGSTRRYPRGEVSEHEIMLLRHKALALLRIDSLTAREIGWLLTGPPPEAIQKRTRRSGRGRRDG